MPPPLYTMFLLTESKNNVCQYRFFRHALCLLPQLPHFYGRTGILRRMFSYMPTYNRIQHFISIFINFICCPVGTPKSCKRLIPSHVIFFHIGQPQQSILSHYRQFHIIRDNQQRIKNTVLFHIGNFYLSQSSSPPVQIFSLTIHQCNLFPVAKPSGSSSTKRQD